MRIRTRNIHPVAKALALAAALAAAWPPSGLAAQDAPAASGPSGSSSIIDNNILGIPVEKPPPPVAIAPPAPVKTAPPPAAPPPPPEKLPFKLVGTMAAKPEASIAVLEKDGKQEAVKVGGVWEQATVVDVQRNRATIRYKQKTSTIEVEFKDWGGPQPAGPIQPVATEAPSAPAPQVTGQAEVPVPESIETRKVPRGEVDRHLQDLAGLLGTMRVQPYYDGGQPAGFLITNIRPGSFIDQVGVTNGDILRFVNGQKVDNVQSAFQLYNIFKNSTNVEVTVMRDTRPVTLKYVIE